MTDPRKSIFWLILAVMLLLAAAAWAQGNITVVKDSGFDTRTRPPVAFDHDEHNQKAEVYDCTVCHHLYENGKKLPGQPSVGMECSACHLDDQSGRLDLIRAYHLQCKTCHLERSAGPIQCGQCHRERKKSEQ